jgi:hypothetical protein
MPIPVGFFFEIFKKYSPICPSQGLCKEALGWVIPQLHKTSALPHGLADLSSFEKCYAGR